MKKICKTLLIILAVLIVLVLGIAIAASPVAKNYIEKHDRELLGRSIRMERLRMNIFTGRLRVEGLKIRRHPRALRAGLHGRSRTGGTLRAVGDRHL